jgi:hypothetical protein
MAWRAISPLRRKRSNEFTRPVSLAGKGKPGANSVATARGFSHFLGHHVLDAAANRESVFLVRREGQGQRSAKRWTCLQSKVGQTVPLPGAPLLGS